MNISDVVNITNGELTNSPKIQAVNSATVYPSKVGQGDLFFSSSQEEIRSAIESGAYAIVYDNDSILRDDNEVAWIRVLDIQSAALKLIRYILLKKETNVYLLNNHEMSFLKMVGVDKRNVTILFDEWKRAFEQLLNSQTTLFISNQQEIVEMIDANPKKLNESKEYQIISDTLFKSSFKIDGYIYQNYDIAPFHIESMAKVLHFLDENHLRYDIEKLHYTKHFVPVFIDNQLQISQSSKSQKVVIFVDNLQDVYEAEEYIKYNQKWIRSVILTPMKTKLEIDKTPVWFESINDVQKKLKQLTYNYAFVYNLDKSILPVLRDEYNLFNESEKL